MQPDKVADETREMNAEMAKLAKQKGEANQSLKFKPFEKLEVIKGNCK
jgi:hypothetical protein